MFVFKTPKELALPTYPVSFCTTFSLTLWSPETLAWFQQLNWSMNSLPLQGVCSCYFPSLDVPLCFRFCLKHFLIRGDALAL